MAGWDGLGSAAEALMLRLLLLRPGGINRDAHSCHEEGTGPWEQEANSNGGLMLTGHTCAKRVKWRRT